MRDRGVISDKGSSLDVAIKQTINKSNIPATAAIPTPSREEISTVLIRGESSAERVRDEGEKPFLCMKSACAEVSVG